VELAALHAQLPQLTAAGASLVAISPELPEHTAATAQKNSVAFEVLSDHGNAVARQFGIAFRLPPDLKELYQTGFKIDLAAKNGIPEYELPIPATFIIDRSSIIRLAFVDPDYTKRLEPAEVVRVVQELAPAPL
jgi:peroxiredoxin